MEKTKALQVSPPLTPKKLALVVLTFATTILTTHASAINTVGGLGESTGVESAAIREISLMSNYGLE